VTKEAAEVEKIYEALKEGGLSPRSSCPIRLVHRFAHVHGQVSESPGWSLCPPIVSGNGQDNQTGQIVFSSHNNDMFWPSKKVPEEKRIEGHRVGSGRKAPTD